jgi:hypothetical protein
VPAAEPTAGGRLDHPQLEVLQFGLILALNWHAGQLAEGTAAEGTERRGDGLEAAVGIEDRVTGRVGAVEGDAVHRSTVAPVVDGARRHTLIG